MSTISKGSQEPLVRKIVADKRLVEAVMGKKTTSHFAIVSGRLRKASGRAHLDVATEDK